MRPAAADRPAIRATVTRASDALASGRTALAYGLAVRGTYQVKRALAAGASRALVADKGVAAARAALRDEVSTLLALAARPGGVKRVRHGSDMKSKA